MKPGNETTDAADPIAALDLRPALFARYRDLTALRYDFPIVLIESGGPDECARPLSAVIETLIGAAGGDPPDLWRAAMAVERTIRVLARDGESQRLSTLLEGTALAGARAALDVDGVVIDCDRDAPARVLAHVWSAVQEERRQRFQREIDTLLQRLRDALRADVAHSQLGLDAAGLKASFGTAHAHLFDFDAMSRLLATSAPFATLSSRQRLRIEALVDALESQTFYADASVVATSCVKALETYRRQYPRMLGFVRTLAMARLEVQGLYDEARHDALFDSLEGVAIGSSDLALFPDSLVTVTAELPPDELAALLEAFAAGVPLKVLAQTDDLLDEPDAGDVSLRIGARSQQLTSMAIGLDDVQVIQAPASHLVRMQASIVEALRARIPALFSVFSGATGWTSTPPYLVAAAAAESRVFPVVTFSPAGSPWSSRLSIDGNPQPDRDWPIHRVDFEDANLQRVTEDVPFTAADFLAADERFAAHVARASDRFAGRPTLLMVDGSNQLDRVAVDVLIERETARCLSRWHALQELSGIHGPHVDRRGETGVASPADAAAPERTAEPAVTEPATPVEPPAETRASTDPYIETARCTTCDECRKINNRMFAYNENRQAYIANPDAGTYAQLVEAAESCQISIIHPGQPRNPNEPGLADLLLRAAPFL
jgi:hypothetical protein